MKNVNYIISNGGITVYLRGHGSFTVTNQNGSYSDIVSLIGAGNDNPEDYIAVKNAVNKIKDAFKTEEVQIEFDEVKGEFLKNGEPLKTIVTEKLLEIFKQGLPFTPLVNLLKNIYKNPNDYTQEEMYLFLETGNLPITEDGCFLAYKRVRGDFKDIYTGKMDNFPGAKPEIPREKCDTDRNNTCSVGLHWCSFDYLSNYSSSDPKSDKIVIVKVNPADVVAIPSDYRNTKGRSWTYEVLEEYKDAFNTSGKLQEKFSKQDVVHREVQEPVKEETKVYDKQKIYEGYDQVINSIGDLSTFIKNLESVMGTSANATPTWSQWMQIMAHVPYMGLVKLLKTLNSVLGVERSVETDVKLQLAATAEQMEKFFNIMRSFDDGAKSVKVAKLHNVRAEAEELRLNTMSNAELTSLYNQKTGSTLKKFSTRAEGIARLKKVLEAEKQPPVQTPKASAIPVVGQNDKFSIAQRKAKLISELKSMTMAELVAVYNQLAIDPIKSFKTKADGVRRIEEQLILAKTCPQY